MNGKRFLTLLLSAILLFSIAVPTASFADKEADNKTETIQIRTEEDYFQLAANCSLDTWSIGKTVTLENDLNFGGEDIPPIPTFNGTFEGNGHTISGMTPSTDGSNQGLFRYILEHGVIRDLYVSGAVAPENGRNYIGGIAGSNYGVIEHCSFTGTISGLNYVGGIAGENHGTIQTSSFYGKTDGKRFTGGIAGYNTGLISNCVNNGDINTEVTQESVDLADLATSSSSLALNLLSAEDENIVSDSGGVAGFSKGIVMNCENHGIVGYQHYGYNVGGIAGRQSGYLTNCVNYGDVFGKKDVAGIVGQMEPYLDLIESMNLGDELALLNKYLNNASGDLSNMSDELQDLENYSNGPATDNSGAIVHESDAKSSGGGNISSDTNGKISDAADSVISDAEESGALSKEDIQKVADDVDTAISSLADAYGILSGSSGDLAYDLGLANDQFSRVMMLLANAMNGSAYTDVFEDVSDQLGEDDTQGRVSRNINYGAVDGDNNIAGIAGAMGIEYEFDLEDNLASTVGANGIVNNTYDAKCISSENVNNGSIVGKKDRVGGIVGSGEMGTVTTCESYGSVQSTEGSYVGGVVGYSDTSVRKCHAMCDVEGLRYVGGIVGYANEISDSACIIQTESSGAFVGAIAGWADMTKEDAILENYFVHDRLGAIDGISYTGKAMPVTYEELIAKDSVPARFSTVTLTFLVDGEVLDELVLDYGADVDLSTIPAVPAREGYTGTWSDFEKNNVHYSSSIEAVYTLNQSTLASETVREDSPLSVVLLEGEFDGGVTVDLTPYEGEVVTAENETVLESWQLQIENLKDSSRNYTVRFLVPSEYRGQQIRILRQQPDGSWAEVETGSSGSYLTFPAEGDEVIFSAVSSNDQNHNTTLYLIIGAASLLILVLILLLRKRGKKETPSVEKADSQPSEPDESQAEETKTENPPDSQS